MNTKTEGNKKQRNFDPNALYSLINSFNTLTNAFKQLNLGNFTKNFNMQHMQPKKPGYGNKGGKKYYQSPPVRPRPIFNLDNFFKAFANGLNSLKFNNTIKKPGRIRPVKGGPRRILVPRSFLSHQIIVLDAPKEEKIEGAETTQTTEINNSK